MLLPTRTEPQTGQETSPRAAYASKESLEGNQLSKPCWASQTRV